MNWTRLATRARLPLGFVLVPAYVVFARPTRAGLLIGAGIALLGIVLRAWAAGHILKNSRLATTGPYAHTRNPLYLGTSLLAAGFGIAVHWGLLLAAVAFIALVYGPTIGREREKIMARFPDDYPVYEANVPAFLPRMRPWRPVPAAAGFSWALYLANREWMALLGYLLALGWLVTRLWTGW